ncbi:hypothetical protein DICPUDRAFT_73924 [Dictyostelium purpureum]|uniref:FNIP repeat-containing protein n=1 Tax=Dictyostelium purpureum TaxID=5786 RepID=F0Z692_DICPU|nr:uncharacterized protein DICPUDRAFT_73924 [Dictyostelium purpureum]EGC40559.1 hypothetical protein DICPUDRAFT_73924 [Dictyostelium purpureum]|eukprot:XP_003282895.1 hypothetical protein DICPUDRAFT_73924 [Dictyostelium purpureum]
MLDTDNKNNNIDDLFFSIWRNKYLLSEIQKHIKLYDEYEIVYLKSMYELRHHSHREYITSVFIYHNEGIKTPDSDKISYKPIEAGDIPETVTSVKFGNNYTQPIDIKSALPSGVTLFEYRNFNQPLTPNTLPPNIKSLTLGMDQEICEGTFPDSLTFLSLYKFNKTISGPNLFNSVVNLHLTSYNQLLKAGDLPKTLETLNLNIYNQPLEPNALPPNLKTLITPGFNCPLTHGSLPDSITELNMDNYKHSLSNSLSSLTSLKKLSMYSYNQDISEAALPSSITSLNLFLFNKKLLPNVLPYSTIILRLDTYNHPLEPEVIPPNVEHLELSSYNCFLSKKLLPNSINYLIISCFGQPFLKDSLSSSIKYLRFCDRGPEIFEMDSIPPSVEILKLPCFYKHPLPAGLIPDSVVDLTLPDCYSPLQVGVLPESLTKLTFGFGFDQLLDPNTIPQSVTQIKLNNRNYPHPISESLTNRLKILK